MEIFLFDTLNKIPQTGAFGDGRGFSGNDSLAIAEGFFFIFVKNGTASISDTHRCYRLKKEMLLVLTPSLKATIHEMDCDFEDARRLLECTDLDIKEIASQLGFSDQSVFGKFFVKKNGISPLKFRLKKGKVIAY